MNAIPTTPCQCPFRSISGFVPIKLMPSAKDPKISRLSVSPSVTSRSTSSKYLVGNVNSILMSICHSHPPPQVRAASTPVTVIAVLCGSPSRYHHPCTSTPPIAATAPSAQRTVTCLCTRSARILPSKRGRIS